MDLKETSAAVLCEQLFNHITNNTKLHSSPWFSDTIHIVPIWINESLGFWGQEKDFLLSLLPKEHSKQQKHHSPRNSITLKDTTEISS